MRTWKATALAVLCVFSILALPALCLADEIMSGNPLKDLYMLKSGRSMRASSSDPAWDSGGNADWRPFGQNAEITIAELEGPGIISHIWMTISNRDRDYSKLMAIRIYWDGEEKPSVEAPIGDFFAVGHGGDAWVDSLPVQVSSDGRARNCFWPMPFGKKARITVTNENPYSGGGILYWYVDWVKLDSLPDEAAYFHAQYTQSYPAKPGRYLVMQAQGRGHYVGTVYSVLATMPSWIGEGDDFFYIDGETEPSLRGTGTEDYFGDAWGFRQFNQPYHGVTVWEGERTGARTTAYRWHIADPVIFNKSLKVEIEHVGPVFDADGKFVSGYGERADHYSTVAFWYQLGGGPNWTSMPIGLDRLPPHIYVEAEKKFLDADNIPKGIEIIRGNGWSGGAYALAKPGSGKNRLEIPFELKYGGNYEMSVDIVHGPNMGSWMVKLDGKVLGLLTELNNQNTFPRPYNWGDKYLSAGRHKLAFDYIGPLNGSQDFGVDGVYLRPMEYRGE